MFRMPQFIMRIWGMSIRSIRRHFRLPHVFLGYFHYFIIVFQVPSYLALIAINYLQFSVFQYIFYCNISFNSFCKNNALLGFKLKDHFNLIPKWRCILCIVFINLKQSPCNLIYVCKILNYFLSNPKVS